MKVLRGSLPRCFTDDFGVDEQDPAIRIRTILFDDVRTGTVICVGGRGRGGSIVGTRSTFNGLCSCMIWAMEEAGLVKRRVETIRDDLSGVLGS